MRAINKHPIAEGTRVYPRMKQGSGLFGERCIVEGSAVVVATSHLAHQYLVTFEGEAEACERELHDDALVGEGVAD